eukprot:3831391-Rhodomonas_salina.2
MQRRQESVQVQRAGVRALVGIAPVEPRWRDSQQRCARMGREGVVEAVLGAQQRHPACRELARKMLKLFGVLAGVRENVERMEAWSFTTVRVREVMSLHAGDAEVQVRGERLIQMMGGEEAEEEEEEEEEEED